MPIMGFILLLCSDLVPAIARACVPVIAGVVMPFLLGPICLSLLWVFCTYSFVVALTPKNIIHVEVLLFNS